MEFTCNMRFRLNVSLQPKAMIPNIAYLLIALLLISFLTTVNTGTSFAQELLDDKGLSSPYTLKWKGNEYPIKFEIDGDRDIIELQACSEGCNGWESIFLILDQKRNDIKLKITVPMSLVNIVIGYAITPTYTTQYREPWYVTSYDIITASFSDEPSYGSFDDEPELYLTPIDASCESVTWEIEVPAYARRIDLSLNGYLFIPEAVPEPALDNKFPFRTNITAAGETFTINMFTNAKNCSFDFNQDDKRLHVGIATIDEEEKGYFRINMPHRLLDGNYTIMVDNKTANFTILGTTEEFSKLIGRTEVFTVMELEYDRDAKSIDVTGTTVVPEFPVNLMAITAMGLIGTLIALRIKRF